MVGIVLYTKPNTSLTDLMGIGDNSDPQNGRDVIVALRKMCSI